MGSQLDMVTPRWLKKKTAAFYSAVGQRKLVELANDPDCPVLGFPDPDNGRGDYIFDRLSLDEYRLYQSGAQYTRDRARAIIESVKDRL